MGNRNGDFAVMRRDLGPITFFEIVGFPKLGWHIKRVAAVDLAQPCVLCPPAVIHCHRALCQGVNREFVFIDHRAFERCVPNRQRLHRIFHLLAQMLRRLALSVAFGGQLELAHRFDV